MAKPMILVVDDQPQFARLISLCLGSRGFDVRTAAGGEEAIERAAELHPDVVLLDVTMAGLDGFQVMDELRARTEVPIIMVTGAATAHQVRRGLDRGADDYVTKPFAPDELAARIRAVLRRGRRSARQVRVGKAVVDLDSGTICMVDARGKTVKRAVSRRSWRLLETLIRHEGKVMYQDELLSIAFGPGFRGDSGYLQEQMRRLRRTLEIPPWSDGPIRTIHGLGYVFEAAKDLPVGRRRRAHKNAPPSIRTAMIGGAKPANTADIDAA